ncbi:MAG TPA: ArsA family ATPase [bacterium]|nr:ArsA family ATPase [bacterium]
MRLILFSGKGGVGKTTISAATSLLAAERGLRTLLVSTDLAHNLSDVLGGKGGDTWQVAQNLWAREVDVVKELASVWGGLKDYLSELLQYFGFHTLMEEEAVLLPGVAEFFSLSSVLDAASSGDYDLVAVDCGPTADTMRMLGFADSAPGRIHRFLKLQRAVVGLLRPFQRRVEVPLPREEALDLLAPLADQADRIRRLLIDPAVTSVRLVMNPDALSLAETRRLYTYLCLFALPVDAVIVNKTLPLPAAQGFFARHYEAQQERRAEIERSFPGPDIITAMLAREEVMGPQALLALGRDLYEKRDPAALLSEPMKFEFARVKGGRVLRVPMPLVEKAKIAVKQQGAHVMIKAGSMVRMITLPDSLAQSSITRANADSGVLTLEFSNQEGARQ